MIPVAMETLAYQTIFRCTPASSPSAGKRTLFLVLVGVIVGAGGWFKCDGSLDWRHLVAWIGGGVAVFLPVGFFLIRNPTLSIEVGRDCLTVTFARGVQKLPWSEIEAARFQEYPIVGMHTTITALLIHARGKTWELTPDFDEATDEVFTAAINHQLYQRGIPATSTNLTSFEHTLSHVGAWVFVLSLFAMLAAHFLGYRFLGTVFGLAFVFTGSVVALMTCRQRLSKLVLVATAVMILGGSAILWACHVNIREALNRWEWQDGRSGRL
jgi:hypothetical protein